MLMKYKLLRPLLLVLCSLGLADADEGKHLFILSGQSNMAGLNPALSFTPTVEKEFGVDSVIVVKDAQGGRPIRDWYRDWKPSGESPAGGDTTYGKLYDRLMGKVRPAIEGQKLASVTFIWMQGERDAKESHGEVYAASFKGLLKQLEADLKRDDLFFVMGRLSDFGVDKASYPHWNMVRDVQVKLAEDDPKGVWVDTDEWNGDNNGLHYNKPGYNELGKAFADKAITLIKGQKSKR